MCSNGSSVEQQLLWLFGLHLSADQTIRQHDLRDEKERSLDLTSRYILELIGVEVITTEEEWLERLLRKFGGMFPGTREFSAFARNAASGLDALGDPDMALVEWMDLEERLFMTLERHVVARRIEEGFTGRRNGRRGRLRGVFSKRPEPAEIPCWMGFRKPHRSNSSLAWSTLQARSDCRKAKWSGFSVSRRAGLP